MQAATATTGTTAAILVRGDKTKQEKSHMSLSKTAGTQPQQVIMTSGKATALCRWGHCHNMHNQGSHVTQSCNNKVISLTTPSHGPLVLTIRSRKQLLVESGKFEYFRHSMYTPHIQIVMQRQQKSRLNMQGMLMVLSNSLQRTAINTVCSFAVCISACLLMLW